MNKEIRNLKNKMYDFAYAYSDLDEVIYKLGLDFGDYKTRNYPLEDSIDAYDVTSWDKNFESIVAMKEPELPTTPLKLDSVVLDFNEPDYVLLGYVADRARKLANARNELVFACRLVNNCGQYLNEKYPFEIPLNKLNFDGWANDLEAAVGKVKAAAPGAYAPVADSKVKDGFFEKIKTIARKFDDLYSDYDNYEWSETDTGDTEQNIKNIVEAIKENPRYIKGILLNIASDDEFDDAYIAKELLKELRDLKLLKDSKKRSSAKDAPIGTNAIGELKIYPTMQEVRNAFDLVKRHPEQIRTIISLIDAGIATIKTIKGIDDLEVNSYRTIIVYTKDLLRLCRELKDLAFDRNDEEVMFEVEDQIKTIANEMKRIGIKLTDSKKVKDAMIETALDVIKLLEELIKQGISLDRQKSYGVFPGMFLHYALKKGNKFATLYCDLNENNELENIRCWTNDRPTGADNDDLENLNEAKQYFLKFFNRVDNAAPVADSKKIKDAKKINSFTKPLREVLEKIAEKGKFEWKHKNPGSFEYYGNGDDREIWFEENYTYNNITIDLALKLEEKLYDESRINDITYKVLEAEYYLNGQKKKNLFELVKGLKEILKNTTVADAKASAKDSGNEFEVVVTFANPRTRDLVKRAIEHSDRRYLEAKNFEDVYEDEANDSLLLFDVGENGDLVEEDLASFIETITDEEFSLRADKIGFVGDSKKVKDSDSPEDFYPTVEAHAAIQLDKIFKPEDFKPFVNKTLSEKTYDYMLEMYRKYKCFLETDAYADYDDETIISERVYDSFEDTVVDFNFEINVDDENVEKEIRDTLNFIKEEKDEYGKRIKEIILDELGKVINYTEWSFF